MEEARMQRRRPRPIRASVWRAAAALTATVVLLAACGGDAGPSAGTTGFTLHTLIVNASAADVTITYTGSADKKLLTCTAELIDYPLVDPFVLAIDGDTVIDTAVALPDGLPNAGQSDLIVEVDVAKDGKKTFDKVQPGSGLTKPSKAAYCPSLPG
jgi:hypothetical protein